jgi:hypothetical protein
LKYYDFCRLSEALGTACESLPKEVGTPLAVTFEGRVNLFLEEHEVVDADSIGFYQTIRNASLETSITSALLKYKYPRSLMIWCAVFKDYTVNQYMQQDTHSLYDHWFLHPLSGALFFNTELPDIKQLLIGMVDWYLDRRITECTATSTKKMLRFNSKDDVEVVPLYVHSVIWTDDIELDDVNQSGDLSVKRYNTAQTKM